MISRKYSSLLTSSSSVFTHFQIPLIYFSFASASTTSSHQQQKPTFYDRLGLDPNTATLEEIKKTYKQRALKCHPDVVQSSSKIEKAKAEAEFRSIAEAYETLSNEKKRKQYDREIGMKSKEEEKEKETQEGKSTSKAKQGMNSRPKSSSSFKMNSTKSTNANKKATFSSKSNNNINSPFLSKDAQRIFREAFEGKSVHDVLFSSAIRNKNNNKSKSKSKTSNDAEEGGSGEEQKELWEKYLNTSREELQRKFKEQHPYANPKDYGFGMRKSHFLNPDEPTSDKFPFRPCASLKFPDHVHPGDEIATNEKERKNVLDVYGDQNKFDLLNVSMEPASGFKDGEDERGEAGRLTKDPEEYGRALKDYLGKRPSNEGMVWSFRRQY
jgi:curved DNA-binding protein CbpA